MIGRRRGDGRHAGRQARKHAGRRVGRQAGRHAGRHAGRPETTVPGTLTLVRLLSFYPLFRVRHIHLAFLSVHVTMMIYRY